MSGKDKILLPSLQIARHGTGWHSTPPISKKGDTVIVTGHTESREYNGKTYTDLVAEWLNIISAESEVRKTAPSGVPYPQGVKFEEDGSDESLPF